MVRMCGLPPYQLIPSAAQQAPQHMLERPGTWMTVRVEMVSFMVFSLSACSSMMCVRAGLQPEPVHLRTDNCVKTCDTVSQESFCAGRPILEYRRVAPPKVADGRVRRRLIDGCQGARMESYLISRLAVVGNPETVGGFKRYPA